MGARRIGLAGACVLLALACAPAFAQNRPQIDGRWVFETDHVYGCVITGTAMLTPRSVDSFHVALTTHQACGALSWNSVQSCVAHLADASASLDCTLVRSDAAGYWPDDFALSIVSADAMDGVLNSTRTWPVRWRRPQAELVS